MTTIDQAGCDVKLRTSILVGILPLLVSQSLSASKEFLLAPNGRHLPFDVEAKAFPVRSEGAGKDRFLMVPEVRLTLDDFRLQWHDNGTYYSFGFDTGDTMALYMEPLADAIVKKLYLYNTDFCGSFCFFLHDALYDGEATTASCVDEGGRVGYYAHVVDGDTVWSKPGESGFWLAGTNECFNDPPVGEELLPALGNGCYELTLDETSHGQWMEVELEYFGVPDTIRAPFFIDAGVHEETVSCPDSWGIGAWDNLEMPYHGFKFYSDPSIRGEPGWWIRSFGWDVYALVEYVEDIPPFIEEVTILYTTISTEPKEVKAKIWDVNPGGGPSGVDAVRLYWEVKSLTDSTDMTFLGDTTYSGTIPGFEPGSDITYWIEATDVNGNRSSTRKRLYSIFQPFSDCLILLNPGNSLTWLHDYYCWPWPPYEPLCDCLPWEPGMNFPEFYTTIVEIATGREGIDCIDEYGEWLDSGGKNYIIAGDEWLGACFYGWEEAVDITPGEFPYDYLGLDYYYPEINVLQAGDVSGVSRILPVAHDVISGDLYEFLGDSLLLNYDPNYEMGFENHLTGVQAAEGATVAYYGMTGILDSLFVPTGTDTVPTAVYRELSNGSRTAFFGFDLLSLNTMALGSDALHGAGYHWVGTYPQGPIPQALLWMDAIVLDLRPSESVPAEFAIKKIYPNPFNPTATIEFSLARDSKVIMTVYDLLGREVVTILNERLDAGHPKVEWNAGDVPSGIYFVRMQAGDPSTSSGRAFSHTQKVTVLR